MPNLNSTMPLREQHIWASLITTALIWGGYLAATFFMWGERSWGQVVGLLVSAVVLHAIALAAIQIVLAANTREEPKDERDILIECRACRIGYYVLLAGVMMTFTGLLVLSPVPAEVGMGRPLLAAHVLVLCAVLAEVAKEGAQVLLYRMSA